MYVRVNGVLSAFNSKKSVNYYHMCPIKDFNEVTCHHLDVINTHLLITRGPIQPQLQPQVR